MNSKYTEKVNIQLLIAGLKNFKIKKIIVSPGTTNVMFVASVQQDSWFELYSAPDERSASYMACGMAFESGEPVVLTCTGATASRNYMPGLTEAFYRKLPVLAVTSMMGNTLPNNNLPQVLDRSVIPNDIANLSVSVPDVHTEDDIWKCTVLINQALLSLKRRGAGPVHINLLASFSYNFETVDLPLMRKMNRYVPGDNFPKISGFSTIAIFSGSHVRWSGKLIRLVESFCEMYDAFVITDQTSGYKGKYAVQTAILAAQEQTHNENYCIDLLLDIGEVSGDYYQLPIKEVWRVSPDGEIKDRFKHLKNVFEMTEEFFFNQYVSDIEEKKSKMTNYYRFKEKIDSLRNSIPELPFSNIWVAKKLAGKIPANSILHLGILNSLRAWNFFEVDESISSISNVGGFGIDGCLSTVLGASIVSPEKLCFCVLGDLAFFYDMNSLGNRYLGKNLRILLINNGKGTEFKNYTHPASMFGNDADAYVAAAGHYGNKSPNLVKNYVEELGFKYLSASTKEEFLEVYEEFVVDNKDKPMLLEVFTDSADESNALKEIRNIEKGNQLKAFVKSTLGVKNVQKLYSIIKK